MVAIFALEHAALHGARHLRHALERIGGGLGRLADPGGPVGTGKPLAERRAFLRSEAVAARAVEVGNDREIGPTERVAAEPLRAAQMTRQPLIDAARLRHGTRLERTG